MRTPSAFRASPDIVPRPWPRSTVDDPIAKDLEVYSAGLRLVNAYEVNSYLNSYPIPSRGMAAACVFSCILYSTINSNSIKSTADVYSAMLRFVERMQGIRSTLLRVLPFNSSKRFN